LIIRDIVFHAKKTYGQFLSSEEKIATNILASRLEQLCDYEILDTSSNQDDKRKITYSLTQKGLDLIPVMLEMMLRSYKYDPQSKALLIPKLMQEIEHNNRTISQEIITLVQQGVPIVQLYL
jgi:DNA-binding HxlR family transcriptional regulator